MILEAQPRSCWSVAAATLGLFAALAFLAYLLGGLDGATPTR
ncbi:hypothetical protein ABEG18_14990 [Alsobacter sp. KACC 23698]|uniref:Uncharacterized protein n=1 Tax=Alsobacter sp. KACC 23698 TaxID=3149229 RepID=A0AAU7JA34_9HYPH